MRAIYSLTSLALLGITAPGIAQSSQRIERVEFSRGTSSATVRGSIRAYQSVDYIVNARAGQPMTVSLRSANGSAYFNVLAPNSQTAIFTGSVAGNRFQGRLSASGDYRVRVYLMRNAARRGERADFSLNIAIGVGNTSRPERPSASDKPGISGSGNPIGRGNMVAFCRGEHHVNTASGRVTSSPTDQFAIVPEIRRSMGWPIRVTVGRSVSNAALICAIASLTSWP